MRRIVVTLAAGAALTASGSGRADSAADEPSSPAPPPDPPTFTMNPPDPTPTFTMNPPAPLPTWDEVASGYPEGAADPPVPALAVTADGSACYKEWYPAGTALPASGGRILAAGEVPSGTAIQCPPERAQAVLQGASGPPPAP